MGRRGRSYSSLPGLYMPTEHLCFSLCKKLILTETAKYMPVKSSKQWLFCIHMCSIISHLCPRMPGIPFLSTWRSTPSGKGTIRRVQGVRALHRALHVSYSGHPHHSPKGECSSPHKVTDEAAGAGVFTSAPGVTQSHHGQFQS